MSLASVIESCKKKGAVTAYFEARELDDVQCKWQRVLGVPKGECPGLPILLSEIKERNELGWEFLWPNWKENTEVVIPGEGKWTIIRNHMHKAQNSKFSEGILFLARER